MKRWLVGLFPALSLALLPIAYAQTTVFPAGYYASDYESITVSTAAVALNQQKVGTSGFIMTVESVAIRVRFDGTAPTSTEGHKLEAGQSFVIFSKTAAQKLKMIRDSGAGSDATVKVSHLSN